MPRRAASPSTSARRFQRRRSPAAAADAAVGHRQLNLTRAHLDGHAAASPSRLAANAEASDRRIGQAVVAINGFARPLDRGTAREAAIRRRSWHRGRVCDRRTPGTEYPAAAKARCRDCARPPAPAKAASPVFMSNAYTRPLMIGKSDCCASGLNCWLGGLLMNRNSSSPAGIV